MIVRIARVKVGHRQAINTTNPLILAVSGGFVFPEADAVALAEASRRRLNRVRRSTASRRMLWTTA